MKNGYPKFKSRRTPRMTMRRFSRLVEDCRFEPLIQLAQDKAAYALVTAIAGRNYLKAWKLVRDDRR